MNIGANERFTPWSLRPGVICRSLTCERGHDARTFLAGPAHPLTVNGHRTAYGDCCVPENGADALQTAKWDQLLSADWNNGLLDCRPGVTLREIARLSLANGWFLGASPGTMKATVGGSVACDVHGKNHHISGSFGDWVEEIDLVRADGESSTCSRATMGELFWATVGGLGHTGLISRVRLKLQPVESGWIRSSTFATRHFDETISVIEAHPESTYSVSWIDSLATGRSMGRGVVMLGEHASKEEVGKSGQLLFPKLGGRKLRLPFVPPNWASPPTLWRTFNAAYHRLSSHRSGVGLVPMTSFFCPLDGVENWNVIYGKRGFLEYQFAVPLRGGLEVCRRVCERLAETGNGSFLAVIKRFGSANKGHLSFPIEGYTLAVDMPYRGVEQEKLLRQLDELVAQSGGRIYLVKDTRLPSDWIPIMYPRLGEWREIVNRNDPSFRFSNHQTARLDLRGMKR